MSKSGEGVDRRRLIIGGATGVLAASLPMAATAATKAPASNWDRETDIICVGSGAAGLSAAVTATSNGDKVIVLEKMPVPGGTTLKSGAAAWLPNNSIMRAAGIKDEEQACLRYMCRYAYPERYSASLEYFGVGKARYDLLRAFYLNAGPAADLLKSSGALELIAFTVPGTTMLSPDYAPTLPENAAVRGRALWPKPLEGGIFAGPAMIQPMTDWLEKKGVPILTETPVTKIVVEEGRVVGVESTQDGKTLRLRARKGVIFATGGFAHNPDLVAMHQRGMDGSCALPGSTGDFIPMAASIGAAMGDLSTAWRMQTVLEEAADSPFLGQGVFIPSGDAMILVDKKGRRVVDEKRNYNDRSRIHQVYDPVADEYPNRVLFMIFDQRGIDVFGGAYPIPENPGDSPHVIAGADWKALAANIAARLPKLAATVGDISLAPDFAASLAATVERWNGFARKGVDEDFHRGRDTHEAEWQPFFSPVRKGADAKSAFPNPILHPFTKSGPYYAVILSPGVLDTSGGPMIDDKARVLSSDGTPIPGLFGAGNCIAAPTRDAYLGGGGTIGPALAFGHIAANSAHG